ncbi:hypothetical protein NE237_022407 [Protea cynaroides]|uniref:Exocyst subunit Exo70 family protein n=1 Tax=Protea cynaroides TaxID=273540 RepID=A0A9Q0HD00_9MAGN|nr:hypothetical protein NE237_022407 [Protea cynaroides]
MNYMKLLVDYSDSLNGLLEDSEDGVERDDDNLQPARMSPVGRRLLSLISSLESNLEEKSKLYEDSAMKERFKNFNLGFEEINRTQTAWKLPDPQLREELRLLISEKVIPAYRSFLGRFGNHLEGGRHAGKYIKYTAEDLEDYLLNLSEGSPGVIHNPRRKIST